MHKQAVAIVGYAFRLPGGIQDSDQLWQILERGESLIGDIPQSRQALFPNQTQEHPTQAGYLNDVAGFDAGFFRMKGLEARYCDPQQRLLLETTWHCLEHGGMNPDQLKGSATGVFVGAHGQDYFELAARADAEINAYWNAGLNTSMLANRISYSFNFRGPSLTVNTACSSSLEALVAATTALGEGLCEQAMVAGVNLILTHTTTIGANRTGMLAQDGCCRAFDHQASGFVRGEGVICMMLKPLDQALAKGNRVLGVIRGAATSHGGHAVSLTAPNLKQQRDLLVNTWSKAGIDPASISFIEAHGTGTRLGDSIEMEALSEAFCLGQKPSGSPLSEEAFCCVGSVKTNLGHLEAAAGLAGVLKVILAMEHECLPKLVHFQKPSPLINPSTSLYLCAKTIPWPRGNKPLRAGVNSFGFGGSYAHVLLEEPPPMQPIEPQVGPVPICLSARDEDALRGLAHNLGVWLKSDRGTRADLGAIAFTLDRGRKAMSTRRSLVVANKSELAEALKQWAKDGHEKPGFFGKVPDRPSKQTQPIDDALTFARDWASGKAVSYTHSGPGVVLPGYCFQHRFYWLPPSLS